MHRFRKLRIHPHFPIWRQQLLIFLSFLLGVFFIFLLYSSFSSAYKFAKDLKNNFAAELSFQSIDELRETLDDFAEDAIPLLQDLQKNLPSESFSYSRSSLKEMETFFGNIQTISQSFPELESAMNIFMTSYNASELLQYLHAYGNTIADVSEKLEFFFDALPAFPNLEKRIAEYQAPLALFQQQAPFIRHHMEALKILLGDKDPHHILILLQNSAEKRATGGFIGSFFDLQMNDGVMQNFSYHDIYEYDGQIRDFEETPLLAEKLVGDLPWSLRDANSSPYFTESAQNFMRLYEKAGGQTVDTVIAVESDFVAKLIDMLGGIYLPDYDIRLNGKNMNLVLSYLVEGKLSSPNPKQILQEQIFPAFWSKLQTEQSPELFFTLYQNYNNYIQSYSRYSLVNNMLTKIFVGNNFQALLNSRNTLLLSQVSISGNKSDQYINQKFTAINRAANIWDISIKRKHNWSDVQDQSFDYLQRNIGQANIPENLLKDILGKGSNRSVFYLYLPSDANRVIALENIENMRVFDLYGKKVVEIESPLLFAGDEQEILFSFETDEKDLKIEQL